MKLLIDAATGSNLKKVWLTTCGAIANEIALKIIRQKKFPASKVFAFKDCFAGRTTAMQEITDNPKYREGQPVYGEVSYLPFYDAHSKSSAAEQASTVIRIMKEECARFPGKFACIEVELVQGEGGFNVAPKEFIAPILEEAKKLNLAVWVDEIQTFGRTGEFFCFQKLGLEKLVDVVTVAKLLQAGAAMYSEEYNPKAGLISGTFSTSSSAIRSGIQAMKILKERMVGPSGRIRELEKLT